MSDDLYKIVRFARDAENRVIQMDLSLSEAQAWCNNPETSSRTCSPEMRELAMEAGFGATWFDGFEIQNPSEETLRERAAADERLVRMVKVARSL